MAVVAGTPGLCAVRFLMAFDLNRIRELAFRKEKLPDHPVASDAEARSFIESLPLHDPAASMVDVSVCVQSINETASFTPSRRARVLMELDVEANRLWKPLSEEFLCPGGVPLEGRDGNHAILQKLQACAAELAMGFALCLDSKAKESAWIKANRGAVLLRRAVWLTRKMILSRMLNLPGADDRWTELNALYRFAEEVDLLRNVGHVFPGDRHTSSVKLEYIRMLLAPRSHAGAGYGTGLSRGRARRRQRAARKRTHSRGPVFHLTQGGVASRGDVPALGGHSQGSPVPAHRQYPAPPAGDARARCRPGRG
jgi:hypothetical protein